MKTLKEIFGPADNAEDYVDHVKVYPQQIAFKKADEYAEEYAKALCFFCDMEEETVIRVLKNFKESLKK
jgi:hypothetical protein